MPRWDSEDGGAADEAAAAVAVRLANKIRKRRAVSSSGGSDPAAGRRLRSRRPAVLLPRRRTSAGGDMSESSRSRHCRGGGGNRLADGARPSASARRLVDAFWQDMDSGLLQGDAAARRSLVLWSGASTEVSKRSRSKSKILEADGKGSRRNGHARWLSADMMSTGSAMEIGTFSQDDVSRCPDKTVNLQDLQNSLIASKELVKVLAHIWGPGELNPSSVSLISALRSELDVARSHVRKLIKEQKSDSYEIEGLKKQLTEEMESWKVKQKEKVANALQFIVSELDTEKKSRKRAEKTNKKLSIALANTEASLQAVTKELDRERKSKGRVEKICNELIRGIDEDKAEVQALKRETEKAQEELQKEREMLQLADEWREQRVQMKLLEARLQFEEKNAAVNQLRDELQAYLDTRKEQEPLNDPMQLSHASENGAPPADVVPDRNGGNCSEDGASEGSDIHSIELNVDGINRTYTWSYTPSSKGRQRSASRHESISDRGMDGVNSWRLEQSFWDMDEELEGDWAEGCSNGMLNLDHDEERYLAIKNLREQMLAGSGFIMSQGREDAEREYCGL
ncbi:hypothetical protein BDA96_06G050700 [Sorghum bicolor]|uniref:Uncharacterized protein n=2 Tax=Sorghum bicolor TaxID=4558 RepID=C5YEB0_SORBI|nr:uncharacterized protein LOC8070932 [Sorghum bicolor]XP_021319593.1 uncharacterized protein LOC8070932 [Sorghum bicolor]XP_021319594.1 uncharacterized protein LOC8070932 [Sorghum bicolor]XP_021319595.1 uncharacterized protein LOC8070932 [Sorghum bicolor]EES11990.1 hypothetical protein SORBI_3006G046600 [Sorghum bicolor]KAG0525372.1 hypothetical protein BDA96_06G050700 [Sorghum bicolor]KXG26063.1 hypothetical protein SORBI_3006G046600 [Sorghum bicolor]OQU81356.1 hypothetical protein SORBI_3|eukprot:XP_002447662.1 uncharacterized protein LOC8070932 [Sorghum bicolor]